MIDGDDARDLGGRPPFEPTDDMRAQVIGLAANQGLTQEEIAYELRIDRKTLTKHFREELYRAKGQVLARIGGGVIRRALAGDNACSFFYLRTHGGEAWRVTDNVNLAGREGGPVEIEVIRRVIVDPGAAPVAVPKADDGDGAGE